MIQKSKNIYNFQLQAQITQQKIGQMRQPRTFLESSLCVDFKNVLDFVSRQTIVGDIAG